MADSLYFGLTPYVCCVLCEDHKVTIRGLVLRRRIPTFRILDGSSGIITWCDKHGRARRAYTWFLGLDRRYGGTPNPRAELERNSLEVWLRRAIHTGFGDAKHLRHLSNDDLADRLRIAQRGRKLTTRRSWFDDDLRKLWNQRVRQVEAEVARRADRRNHGRSVGSALDAETIE